MGVRLIVAFLLSPLMTSLVFVVAVAFRVGLAAAIGSIPVILLIHTPFAYLAMAVFGLPAFFIFRALGWSRFPVYIFAGAVFGFLACWLIAEFIIDWAIDPTDYIWSAIAGASSGLVFSLILFKLDLGALQQPSKSSDV